MEVETDASLGPKSLHIISDFVLEPRRIGRWFRLAIRTTQQWLVEIDRCFRELARERWFGGGRLSRCLGTRVFSPSGNYPVPIIWYDHCHYGFTASPWSNPVMDREIRPRAESLRRRL